MEHQKHERFAIANEELNEFLRRADGLATGAESITEGELQSLSERLSTPAPEIGDASRGEELDEELQKEIAEYVKNFCAFQTALERARYLMLARKVYLESTKRHLDGVLGWVNAFSQTT